MMLPRTLAGFLGLVCLTALIIPAAGRAATIRVPTDQPTIQAGIDAASPMDSVLVAPGTYSGAGNVNLDFRGDDIVLLSEAGAPATVIDGQRAARGFDFHSGESRQAIVQGFTVTRCFPPSDPRSPAVGGPAGGGMRCISSASPTVIECRFTDNQAFFGGGADCLGTSPAFIRCVFDHNFAIECGGGMSCVGGGAPVLTECIFSENGASGGGCGGVGSAMDIGGSSPQITRCTFSMTGDIFIVGSSSPSLTGCTLYRSFVSISLLNGAVRIQNTIIAFNSGPHPAVFCDGDWDVMLTSCDVYGNAGGDWVACIAGQQGQNGNISADPLFCNAPMGDFTLHSNSPCAPEQTGDCGLIGAWPVACGATAIEPSTWGRIKLGFGR